MRARNSDFAIAHASEKIIQDQSGVFDWKPLRGRVATLSADPTGQQNEGDEDEKRKKEEEEARKRKCEEDLEKEHEEKRKCQEEEEAKKESKTKKVMEEVKKAVQKRILRMKTSDKSGKVQPRKFVSA